MARGVNQLITLDARVWEMASITGPNRWYDKLWRTFHCPWRLTVANCLHVKFCEYGDKKIFFLILWILILDLIIEILNLNSTVKRSQIFQYCTFRLSRIVFISSELSVLSRELVTWQQVIKNRWKFITPISRLGLDAAVWYGWPPWFFLWYPPSPGQWSWPPPSQSNGWLWTGVSRLRKSKSYKVLKIWDLMRQEFIFQFFTLVIFKGQVHGSAHAY